MEDRTGFVPSGSTGISGMLRAFHSLNIPSHIYNYYCMSTFYQPSLWVTSLIFIPKDRIGGVKCRDLPSWGKSLIAYLEL